MVKYSGELKLRAVLCVLDKGLSKGDTVLRIIPNSENTFKQVTPAYQASLANHLSEAK